MRLIRAKAVEKPFVLFAVAAVVAAGTAVVGVGAAGGTSDGGLCAARAINLLCSTKYISLQRKVLLMGTWGHKTGTMCIVVELTFFVSLSRHLGSSFLGYTPISAPNAVRS